MTKHLHFSDRYLRTTNPSSSASRIFFRRATGVLLLLQSPRSSLLLCRILLPSLPFPLDEQPLQRGIPSLKNLESEEGVPIPVQQRRLDQQGGLQDPERTLEESRGGGFVEGWEGVGIDKGSLDHDGVELGGVDGEDVGLEDLLLFNGTRHTSDASRPEKLNDPGNDEDLCKTEFLLGGLIDVVEEIHAKVPSARLRIVDLLGEVLEIGEVGKGVERELLNVLEGEGRGEAREVVEEEVSFVSFRFCESHPLQNPARILRTPKLDGEGEERRPSNFRARRDTMP
ncbi:hypothetical protein BDY24DRAFT_390837 [Mrakia frigida]|uniref:uncharacterized protein n=1 Tax=Mrakia frigida TaxID=29902 RepID=UPI003FCC0C0B